MRLDAHQHFWSISRGDYGWLNEDIKPLYRDFLPKDLSPLLHHHGIDGTILVQAAPTVEETHYLLTLASDNAFVQGVVGWVDFSASDVQAQIATLAKNTKLVGLRPMIQDIANPSWMLSPEVQPAFEALINNNLSFDALTKPVHLESLCELQRRYPQLVIIIDHASKPNIAAGEFEPWASHMRYLARNENCYCKFSGLMTEAKQSCTAEDLKPYSDLLLDTFGAERLIWGSDWPVCTLAGSYDNWLSISEQLLQKLDKKQLAAVFGENARQAYRLAQD